MSPQLLLCTLVTIIIHSVGSVNHALCLAVETVSCTGGDWGGGPEPGGSAREILTIRSSRSTSSYVNPYQTYLVHQCTTRATRQLKLAPSSSFMSLAATQQHQVAAPALSASCPCRSLGFFSSFSSTSSSLLSSDSYHHHQQLVKGRWLWQPEWDSSSSAAAALASVSSSSSASHLTTATAVANNTYHYEVRPCAPSSTSSSTSTSSTITSKSQLQNLRRRRRRNIISISISSSRIVNQIRSRSMLQQYGSTLSSGSTSVLLALSPLHPHHHHHQSLEHPWSPANVELFQAVAKVTILVLLKLLIKYYVRGYFKAAITSSTLFELLDLISKALTIAIAKCAIKWALYPALRTAAKTLLIASLRSLLKPIINPLIKGGKKQQSCQSPQLVSSSLKFALTLAVKVVIKTTALEMLVLVFENEATQLPLHQLVGRVTLILLVKMSAKRVCKLGKQKVIQQQQKEQLHNSKLAADDDVKGNASDTSSSSPSAPVDKMLMFAIQKLVTKLVKIPLIKMLL